MAVFLSVNQKFRDSRTVFPFTYRYTLAVPGTKIGPYKMLYLQNKQIIHSHLHFSQSYILPITRLTPLSEIYKQMGIGDGCCFSYSGTGILQSLWDFPEGKKECFLSLNPFISLLLSELTIQQCLTREGPLGAPQKPSEKKSEPNSVSFTEDPALSPHPGRDGTLCLPGRWLCCSGVFSTVIQSCTGLASYWTEKPTSG